jgi:hypothetical protein
MPAEPGRPILPTLLVAAVGGTLAILAPGLVGEGSEGLSLWRAAVETPSVWSFQGLFVVGFFLAAILPLGWSDLPLVALAMVGVFPVVTLAGAATGGAGIGLQQELYLEAAWLIPSLIGLIVGKTIRDLQRRLRDARGDDRPRPG